MRLPRGSTKPDWEVELGMVIGRRTSYLDSVDDARDAIAGYLVVNGVRRQTGTTRTMVFDPFVTVHHLSQFVVLEPGDLIDTGTPPGSAWGSTRRSGCSPATSWSSASRASARSGSACSRRGERPHHAGVRPDRSGGGGGAGRAGPLTVRAVSQVLPDGGRDPGARIADDEQDGSEQASTDPWWRGGTARSAAVNGRAWALLRRPAVQRGIRAAIAAGLAWQVAVLLPPALSDYAYYAPLGAVIAVHPTVADSAGAAWRTVLAILLGFGLAVVVYEATPSLPRSLTIALLVALAIAVEKWGLLGQQAGWVSFAAVLMLTVGAEDPGAYVLRYAGLTLIGAVVGVLVTTVLFPPLQLTQAVEQIARTRDLLATHLEQMAARLARDRVPSPAEERRWMARLGPELDRMRRAESLVERARQANPRARRWQESAVRIRAESRALDRVAVLIDDLTALVSELQPHRRGDGTDVDTAELLGAALTALAGVLRHPYHSGDGTTPDPRSEQIKAAVVAVDRMVERVTSLPADRSLLPLSAVVVGVQRGLLALDADQPYC